MKENKLIEIIKKHYPARIDRLSNYRTTGVPDLMMYSTKFMHYCEVKTSGTRLTDNQKLALDKDPNGVCIKLSKDEFTITIICKSKLTSELIALSTMLEFKEKYKVEVKTVKGFL